MKILRSRRVLIGGAAVAGLLVFALWPRGVEVDMATVTRGPLTVTVDEEGETRVRNRFIIAAPVAGELERIELEPGDAVRKAETVVARLQPAPPTPLDVRSRAEARSAVQAAEAALGRARADRDRAAAELARAKQRLERMRKLLEVGGIARDEVDALDTEAQTGAEALRAAEFNVARAEYDVEAVRAQLIQSTNGDGDPIDIVAPVNGVVLERERESEAVVPAGEPLLEIGDPANLEIVSDLLSADAVKVKPGDAVLIEQWGGDTTLHGTVRRVEPSGFTKISALGVEEQRVDVIIDFADVEAAWHALGDGYRVEVRIVIWQRDDVLRVPIGSLFRRDDEWALFAVEGGRARARTVTIGRRDAVAAQVLSGVETGDEVVLYPPDDLEDGDRVTRRTR